MKYHYEIVDVRECFDANAHLHEKHGEYISMNSVSITSPVFYKKEVGDIIEIEQSIKDEPLKFINGSNHCYSLKRLCLGGNATHFKGSGWTK